MVGLVLASHGTFCEGLKFSCEMIAGEVSQCETCALMPGEDPDAYGERLRCAIDNVDSGDGVLVLVDIKGGTPFNQSLMLCREKNIQIIVGTNLPMLLVVALGRNEADNLDVLTDYSLADAKDSIDVIKYNR